MKRTSTTYPCSFSQFRKTRGRVHWTMFFIFSSLRSSIYALDYPKSRTRCRYFFSSIIFFISNTVSSPICTYISTTNYPQVLTKHLLWNNPLLRTVVILFALHHLISNQVTFPSSLLDIVFCNKRNPRTFASGPKSNFELRQKMENTSLGKRSRILWIHEYIHSYS